MDMPGIDKLTEKESAHPSQKQLDKLTRSGLTAPLFSTGSDFPELVRQHSTHTDSPEGSLASPTEPKAKSDRAGATAADNPTPTVSHSPARSPSEPWMPTQDWVTSWKTKLPLQTIMRLLQVLVPQVYTKCVMDFG